MKTHVLAFVAILIFNITFFAPTVAAQPDPELKGKTYICFLEGQFDEFPNFASAFKIIFDQTGTSGKTRTLSAYKPESKAAEQTSSTFTCTKLADGRKYFGAKNEVGGDQGGFIYTSYDNGARIWITGTIPGRHVYGWMLLLPRPLAIVK